MSQSRKLEGCNRQLASQLGGQLHRQKGSEGSPVYQWFWSEDLKIDMQDRDNPWDYRADPSDGLIKLVPRYIRRSLCHDFRNQWVLCVFMPPVSEKEWFASFGRIVPWPEKGYYAPTN